MLDDDRRGPRGDFFAIDFPPLVAGALVERDDERISFVVPVDDERVAVKHGRASLAVAVQRLHRPEVGFPNDFAFEVEAIQPERAKDDKQLLAVGHRRVRGQAARLMPLLVRQRLAELRLPDDLAAGPVDRQGDELVAMRDGQIVVIARRRARPGGQRPANGIAVVRKMRSPQTMGVEWPRPGIGVFQRMFVPSASSQSSGGSPSGATPVASGPRHAGQLSIASPLASPSARAAPATKPTSPSSTSQSRGRHQCVLATAIRCVRYAGSRLLRSLTMGGRGSRRAVRLRRCVALPATTAHSATGSFSVSGLPSRTISTGTVVPGLRSFSA